LGTVIEPFLFLGGTPGGGSTWARESYPSRKYPISKGLYFTGFEGDKIIKAYFIDLSIIMTFSASSFKINV
jgi:hypothetical protein